MARPRFANPWIVVTEIPYVVKETEFSYISVPCLADAWALRDRKKKSKPGRRHYVVSREDVEAGKVILP